jgi:hypothetical protein
MSKVWLAGLAFAGFAHGAAWFVDSAAGNDANAGNSAAAAWRTLKRVAEADFQPGDRILLRCGSVFREQLAPHSSGSPGAPIVIDRYGEGPMPRIDAGDVSEDAVLLRNVQHIEVRNLEVTNRGAAAGTRRGVHILLDNFGTASQIVVSGMYVHDVNGANQRKDNGGIIFSTNGDRVPSRFDGLTIERNMLRAVDRSAIAARSSHWPRTKWFASLRVVIRDNYVEDVGGDGIVPWVTDGARIEHNIVRHANRRANSDNAGIWPWSADNSVFEWNEAAFTHTTRDGQGFDSDYNSRGTRFEYNYSHDNEGGFLLICSMGRRDPKENIGNSGTVARRNISRNDRSRIFHISAVEHTLIEENAIYVGPGLDVQMVLMSDWSGWASDTRFVRNRFYVEGTARYGHGTAKNPDGTYTLADGWGPAVGTVFEGNLFQGKHVPMPTDGDRQEAAGVSPPQRKWNSPEFDFAHPERFDAFMASHRAWMRQLMESEFGPLP